MNEEKEPERKPPFQDAMEIVLSGTPKIILPLIRRVARESSFGNYEYSLPEEAGMVISTAFAELQIQLHPKVGTFGYDNPFPTIGVITLQELPNKQTTLFRVPPRSQWGEAAAFDFDSDGSYFTRFLARVFAEFQRLGFVDFKEEKPPLGFKLPHREKDVQS